ncbi:MAG: trehalase family glycosidase, partial [Bacteroidota bacterium]
SDKLILSGGVDEWEATYFKPARYLTVYIRANVETVKLHDLGLRSLRYPFIRRGKISSPDAPWLKAYMEATAKTIETCTTDAYTDNYRERRQYAQTGYYASLGNYWLFADTALQRRYLLQVAQEQEAGGIMPAYAPLAGADYMVILDSNCLWMRSLRNYLLFSGDYATVRSLLPTATKLMDLLATYTNELGMLDNPPYPYWLDHAPLDRNGANLALNAHYLGALEDFAEVKDWLGVPGAASFFDKTKTLRSNLRTHLWDEERGLFSDALVDGVRSDRFSEQANGLALALGIADEQQADRIAQQLLGEQEHDLYRRPSGLIVATPAMSYFLHKGLCEAGYAEASFGMFRQRFDRMLAPGTNQTLWEEWWVSGPGRTSEFQRNMYRSDAQTESAFPPALFAEY